LLLLIIKNNLNLLVSENFRNNPNIDFHSLWKQPKFIDFWKILESIPTLAFAHCKSNSIILTSHHIYNSSTLLSCLAFIFNLKFIFNFISYRQLKFISFPKLHNNPNIDWRSLWKQLNYINFTSYLQFIHITFMLSIHY